MLSRYDEISGIVRTAANTLSPSIRHYWPSDRGNDAGEANVVMRLGHVVLGQGFSVCAEVWHPHLNGHFDLLGISPALDGFLAYEVKRMLGGSTNAMHSRQLLLNQPLLQRRDPLA